MSEDALTWNVFVGFARRQTLHRLLNYLTGRNETEEPELYLWGKRIFSLGPPTNESYGPLSNFRLKFEPDIRGFHTEPDVILTIPKKLTVCVEAKFASGNTLSDGKLARPGEKPTDREGLIQRYIVPSRSHTHDCISRDALGQTIHSQLFRNIICASEMAAGAEWHVANLVSQTQWKHPRATNSYSFENPEPAIRGYLKDDKKNCFSFRTWESIYSALVDGDPQLEDVANYMRKKSAHYRPAFNLA